MVGSNADFAVVGRMLGKAALDKIGRKKWRKRVAEMVAQLEPIWNYRKLYLGGGNAKFLKQDKLPENVAIRSNEAGLLGGIALWGPLAPALAGVVLEVGGPFQHIMIVCREFGIPGIANAKEATTRLTEGQLVVVDANHGWVLPAE